MWNKENVSIVKRYPIPEKMREAECVTMFWCHKNSSPLTNKIFFFFGFFFFFGRIGAPQGLISLLLPFKTRWEALADVTIAYDFPLR